MSSAEAILANRRAAGAARSRAHYERHKVRILADRREGYRLVRAQYRAAHPPAPVDDVVMPDQDFAHDDTPAHDDDPTPAAPKKVEHAKYNVEQAVATINKINELYPNEPPRKASTIYTTRSAIRAIFRKLAVGDDLHKVLQYPKKVIKVMQDLVDSGEAKLSTTTTQHTQILLLMDHLPGLNLSEKAKNEYRRHAKALKEYSSQVNLEKKATVEYDIMRFPAYVQKIDEMHGTDSIQSLLAHTYREVPVRDDFHAMRLVADIKHAVDKHQNYLVMPRGAASMVINAYKTDGKYAATQLASYPLSAKLKAKLAAYIAADHIAPGNHLFPKYVARGFSALVSNTMNKPLGIKLGVDALRSITIATNKEKNKGLSGLEKILAGIDLAQKMHHSHKTAPAYVRNLALDEGDAPPKRRAGRPKKAAPVVAPPPPVKRGRGRPKSIKP